MLKAVVNDWLESEPKIRELALALSKKASPLDETMPASAPCGMERMIAYPTILCR